MMLSSFNYKVKCAQDVALLYLNDIKLYVKMIKFVIGLEVHFSNCVFVTAVKRNFIENG